MILLLLNLFCCYYVTEHHGVCISIIDYFFYSKIYAENDEENAIQMASKLNRLVLFISLFS